MASFPFGLFPEDTGAFFDDHGERFHQDISHMEKRCTGECSPDMLAEYCWRHQLANMRQKKAK